MKRTMAMLCMILGAVIAANAAPAQEKIQTSVEKVTLFIDGAQITRTKQVDLPAGNPTITFTGLSPYLDDKSMQVSGKGRFTVTAVNHRFNYADSAVYSAQQKALNDQIVKIGQQRKQLNASREVVEADLELLKTNCSVRNRTAVTSLAGIKELNDYYSSRMLELKNKIFALDEQLLELNTKEQTLRNEQAQLGGKQASPMSEIQVSIEAPAACKASFSLVYYVRNAGWFPSYDVRSEGLAHPVEISYKANIFQNTKEEWKNVELTLSSSNPNTGSIAPQLRTYWLDYGLQAPRYTLNQAGNSVSGTVMDQSREPIIGATVMIPGTTIGTSTDINGRYTLTLPNGAQSIQVTFLGYEPKTLPISGNVMNVVLQEQALAMDEVVVVAYGTAQREVLAGSVAGVQVRGGGKYAKKNESSAVMEVGQTQTQLGYEFQIKRPYTVASGGKSVVAEIGRFDLPAAYSYQSSPKIDKDAFLMAEATDWEKLNLLQGEANVYFENTFVGKSILDPARTTDTLRFSMGRDQGIRIERKKENDYVSRKSIGSNKTQSTAWKITVRNTRAESAQLTLYDQIPVSRNSTITVSAEELSGGQLDAASGIITWKLDLKPGEQRELLLHYTVKYPKGHNLAIE